MRITQGCFSFLPDLTDTQIAAQINYCLDQNWAVAIEFTDDPHPRNTYWNMWGLPMFDLRDPAGVMGELKACREAKPETYIHSTPDKYTDSDKHRNSYSNSDAYDNSITNPAVSYANYHPVFLKTR